MAQISEKGNWQGVGLVVLAALGIPALAALLVGIHPLFGLIVGCMILFIVLVFGIKYSRRFTGQSARIVITRRR